MLRFKTQIIDALSEVTTAAFAGLNVTAMLNDNVNFKSV